MPTEGPSYRSITRRFRSARCRFFLPSATAPPGSPSRATPPKATALRDLLHVLGKDRLLRLLTALGLTSSNLFGGSLAETADRALLFHAGHGLPDELAAAFLACHVVYLRRFLLRLVTRGLSPGFDLRFRRGCGAISCISVWSA